MAGPTHPRPVMPRVGFMQGRLSDQVDGKIQAFPWDSWEAEFATARDVGFDLMEWTIDQVRLHENPLMSASGRARIRELSAASGVEIRSLTGDCFMQAPFYKEDGAARKALLNDLDDIIEASSELHIRHILVPLVDGGALATAEQEQSLRDGLMPLRPRLIASRIKVVFELDFEPSRAATFISAFPADAFGINYDIGNSASLGFDPAREVDAYGHRIDNVHVKDRLLGGTTVPLGEGSAHFEQAFGALQRIGYGGNLILQTARAADGAHGRVLSDYRRLTVEWWEGATARTTD